MAKGKKKKIKIKSKSANVSPAVSPARSSIRSKQESATKEPLLFTKRNYMIMLGGLGLMVLGFLLMAGGHMPSPDVWDDGLIYSFRRITLAPFLILVGLGVQVYAIFHKG